MKSIKKRKFRIVHYGKPSLSDIAKTDAEAFYKSLLEIILDLHTNNEENKKEL